MIIHDKVEQGTDEWLALRKGKFTASIASKLLTPTGKVSVSYKDEMGRIIAETLGLQPPEPHIETYWMARGSELEAQARKWFTVDTGFDVEEVGFIESDSHLIGVSPDGVINAYPTDEDGNPVPDGEGVVLDLIPLELKVPKPSTHISWLIQGVLPKAHIQQVHFSMAVTGAPYAYFMSYSPDIEPIILRVERDDYTEKMVNAIEVYEADFKWSFNRIMGEANAE
jgi:hypothetical protein